MTPVLRLWPILAMIAACTNTGDDYGELARILAPQSRPPDARIRHLQQAGAARLQVGFAATGLSGLMLHEGRRDRVDTWLSVDGAALITERGMLRGTRGFGEGLMAAENAASLRLLLAARPGSAQRFHSYLTGDDRIEIRGYRCVIDDRGPTDGGATRLMTETCRNLDQSFVNLYWVTAGDRIVQSRQWAGEFLGNISTRELPP